MRFGVLAGHEVARRTASDWTEFVKRVEDSGVDCLLLPDHLGPGPGVVAALTAAAFVSERLRLGYLVLGNDFRHPVLLARETATIDVLSGGRFELGLGAGWKESEYRSLGVDYRPAPVRIERLGEALSIVDRVLVGRELLLHRHPLPAGRCPRVAAAVAGAAAPGAGRGRRPADPAPGRPAG